MKIKFSLLAGLLALSGTASANPPPNLLGTDTFLHASDAVDSVAACVVGVKNAKAGISDCLCAAGNGEFSFCSNTQAPFPTVFTPPEFAAAWAADVQSQSTSLVTADTWDGAESLYVDARGACSLDQASLELALTPGTTASSRGLKAILGAKASYSAVYMYPTVGGVAAGDPVRLCGLGQLSANLSAGLQKSRSSGWVEESDWHQTPKAGAQLTASLTGLDIGIAGAAQWVLPATAGLSASPQPVGVTFVLVSAVADAVLQTSGVKGITAIGVLANTLLTDRTLLLEKKPNLFPLTPPS